MKPERADRAVEAAVEVRYGPKLSVHPRRAFSFLLGMQHCLGLFTEVTYSMQASVRYTVPL